MIAISAYCESEPEWTLAGNGEGLTVQESDADGEAYYPMHPELYPHYLATLGACGRTISDTMIHGRKMSARATVIDCPRRGIIRLHAAWEHEDSGMSRAWLRFIHNLDFGRYS